MTDEIEQQARKYWKDAASDPVMASYSLQKVMTSMLENDALEDEDGLRLMDEQVSAHLELLGYSGVKLETFLNARQTSKENDLGCWYGRYTLFDEAGGKYNMYIFKDNFALIGEKGMVSDCSFSAGTLTLANETYKASLTFQLPTDTDQQLDGEKTIASQVAGASAPRVSGSITISDSTITLSITGKRDCYSKAGVDQQADGDPLAYWCGGYSMVLTDGDWQWLDDELVLRRDDTGNLPSVTWGGKTCPDVRFLRNILFCRLTDGSEALLTVTFSENADGKKLCRGGLKTADRSKSISGFFSRSV